MCSWPKISTWLVKTQINLNVSDPVKTDDDGNDEEEETDAAKRRRKEDGGEAEGKTRSASPSTSERSHLDLQRSYAERMQAER